MSDCCDPCAPLVPPAPGPNPDGSDGIVVFDPARFAARFPEFTVVPPATAQEYFYDATMYIDNSPCSPICDSSIGGERERLLYLMTAHLAYLAGPIPGIDGSVGAGATVGRATNKSVGPVSIGYGGLEGLPGSAAWYAQTKYGLSFWQLTSVYRTFRYRTPLARAYPAPGYPWVRGIAYPWP